MKRFFWFIDIKIITLSDQGWLESRVTLSELCAQSRRSVPTCVTTRCGRDELVELINHYVNVEPQDEQSMKGSWVK